MELQEQVNALEAEKKQYIQMIDNLNAEKIALDQMYVGSLKEVLSIKKELILLNSKANDLNNKLNVAEKEKEALKVSRDTFEELASQLQSKLDLTGE